MEYKSVVYNAARDGNLRRLKVFLDCRSDVDVQMLLSSCTFGTPPLVISSRNGHLDVVRYLVEKRTDIEQPGYVVFDGETIEGAPPLWCAAAAGHFDIVKFLVESGANVNHTTATNSTPLRAACFDGHLDIVKYLVEHGADVEIANRHGHTSLMIACYRGHTTVVKYLLSVNANVNRKSVKGNTALHDSAESGSVEILKILLEKGAIMDVDSYGLTPMLAAATLGHATVVEFLAEHEQCSYQERVDGLQLLGATFIDKKRDLIGAFRYWRRALTLRRNHLTSSSSSSPSSTTPTSSSPPTTTSLSFPTTTTPLSPSTLSQSSPAALTPSTSTSTTPPSSLTPSTSTSTTPPSSPPTMPPSITIALDQIKLGHDPVSAYGSQREVSDLDELELLIGDPDKVRMQALLIRERILGPAHPDTTYYIRYRGAVYADVGNFDRCVELWLYALKMQQKIMEPLCALTLGSFVSFAELFSFMLNDALPHRGRKLRFDDIFNVLKMASIEVMRSFNESEKCKHVDKEKDGMHKLCLVVLHLICLLCRCVENRTADVDQEMALKKAVYDLIRIDPRGGHQSPLLHLACNADSTSLGRYPVCRFPSLNVVELMLHCGADVTATDEAGNTSLHVVLSNKIHRRSIVMCLLNAGCDLNVKNKANKTSMDLIKTSGVEIAFTNFVTLKCLSARAVRQHDIYYRNHVPTSLISYLESH